MLIILLWLKIIETNLKALDSLLKTNPWTYKIRTLSGEKEIGSNYPEPDSPIRNKVKEVIVLPNYTMLQALVHLI